MLVIFDDETIRENTSVRSVALYRRRNGLKLKNELFCSNTVAPWRLGRTHATSVRLEEVRVCVCELSSGNGAVNVVHGVHSR